MAAVLYGRVVDVEKVSASRRFYSRIEDMSVLGTCHYDYLDLKIGST